MVCGLNVCCYTAWQHVVYPGYFSARITSPQFIVTIWPISVEYSAICDQSASSISAITHRWLVRAKKLSLCDYEQDVTDRRLLWVYPVVVMLCCSSPGCLAKVMRREPAVKIGSKYCIYCRFAHLVQVPFATLHNVTLSPLIMVHHSSALLSHFKSRYFPPAWIYH